MVKNALIFLFSFLTISNSAFGHNFFESRSLLKELAKRFEADKYTSPKACETDSDCLKGFFCKLGDCIAKKADGALCLSGKNEECECGKCSLDIEMFTQICSSQEDSCSQNGVTPYNQCQSSNECPKNHYCDFKYEKVCKSKLGPNRACYADEMCLCNQCEHKSVTTMWYLPAIKYSVCGQC